jgi:hypothetical protein
MGSVKTGVMDAPVERTRGRARGGGWAYRPPGPLRPLKGSRGHPLGDRNDLMVGAGTSGL